MRGDFIDRAREWEDFDRAAQKRIEAEMDTNPHIVTLDKYRSTWNWYVKNPQGGGFGSSHCGLKKHALEHAISALLVGTRYRLITNGRDEGLFTRF